MQKDKITARIELLRQYYASKCPKCKKRVVYRMIERLENKLARKLS
jgi:phage FluMu protein Com